MFLFLKPLIDLWFGFFEFLQKVNLQIEKLNKNKSS
jgi:hypothetical protein